MKKLLSIFSALIICVTLTACSEIIQVDQRAIVQAIGLDKSDAGYKISLQIFNPQGGSTTEVGGMSVKTVTAEGDTVYTALKNAELKQGKQIFLGHNKLIIIGKSFMNDDIEVLLNYFVKDNMAFIGTDVVMTDGNAYDLINLELMKGVIGAEKMQDILHSCEKSGTAKAATMIKIISDMQTIQRATTIPIMNMVGSAPEVVPTASDNEGEKDKAVNLVTVSSTALLKGGRVVTILSPDETAGLKWLNSDVQHMFFTIRPDGTKVSINIQKANVNLKPLIVDNRLVIRADISVNADILDFNGSSDISTLPPTDVIQKEVSETIKSQCESAINATLKSQDADVMGIEKMLKFYQKDYYNLMKNNYDDVVSQAKYDINVKVKINN